MKHVEVLTWETIGNADGGSPMNHTCQPTSDWNDDRSNTVSSNFETELASKEKMLQRKSGFAASTMLLNAVVARCFLVQRRKGILEGHNDSGKTNDEICALNSFFQKFQEDTDLVISRDRYERACLVARAALEAFPVPAQKDPAICSHTFGIWCVGQSTKALPNSLLLAGKVDSSKCRSAHAGSIGNLVAEIWEERCLPVRVHGPILELGDLGPGGCLCHVARNGAHLFGVWTLGPVLVC